MKQKDYALIAVTVVFAAIVSFFLSNMLFSPKDDLKQSVDKFDTISSEFPEKDSKYFNKDSIDPTLQVQIQDNSKSNTDPFPAASQQ